jgi:hypothetical protein
LEYKADKENREMLALKRRQKEKANASEEITDDMVRTRMGILKFYMMPWAREGEKKTIAKIAAIEAELEVALAATKAGADVEDALD